VALGEEERFEGQEHGTGNDAAARAESARNGLNLRIEAGCNTPAANGGGSRRGRGNGEVGRRAGGARAPGKTAPNATKSQPRKREGKRGGDKTPVGISMERRSLEIPRETADKAE
jgi:hypothetical protein